MTHHITIIDPVFIFRIHDVLIWNHLMGWRSIDRAGLDTDCSNIADQQIWVLYISLLYLDILSNIYCTEHVSTCVSRCNSHIYSIYIGNDNIYIQGRSQKWAMEGVLTLKYTARCQKCLFINMFKIWAQGGGGSDPHTPYAPGALRMHESVICSELCTPWCNSSSFYVVVFLMIINESWLLYCDYIHSVMIMFYYQIFCLFM